jgi:hypothetical protein
MIIILSLSHHPFPSHIVDKISSAGGAFSDLCFMSRFFTQTATVLVWHSRKKIDSSIIRQQAVGSGLKCKSLEVHCSKVGWS